MDSSFSIQTVLPWFGVASAAIAGVIWRRIDKQDDMLTNIKIQIGDLATKNDLEDHNIRDEEAIQRVYTHVNKSEEQASAGREKVASALLDVVKGMATVTERVSGMSKNLDALVKRRSR
jgi:hypothetical protein